MFKKLIILFMVSIVFVSCGQTNSTDENIGQNLISENLGEDVISRAKIVDIDENSVLLCGVDDENSIYSLTTMSVDNLPEDAQYGSIIDIYFDGLVMESYPARISNIEKIEVVEQDCDTVGLFIELIKDLYYKNEYLIQTNDIALVLITDDVLTRDEEMALLYMTVYEIDENISYNIYEKEVLDNEIMYDNDEEIVFFIDAIKAETGIIFDIGMLLPVAIEEYEGDFVLMDWYEDCQIITNGEEYQYIHGTEYNDIF